VPVDDLRARREAVVVEHMESENVHDFDTTLGTFAHPRYEIVPTGDVFERDRALIRLLRPPPRPAALRRAPR
jgi:hypothetical protein